MPELVVPAVIGSEASPLVHDVDAKIDTGADMSIIPGVVQKALDLKRSGLVVCRGARGERSTDVPTYYSRIRVAGGNWLDVKVVESTHSYMLVGMDVLRHYLLFVNGPKQYFELKSPAQRVRNSKR